MKQKTQLKWSVLLLAVVYANYVAYDNFFRPGPNPHWGEDQVRNPASMNEFNLPAAEVLEDYFQYDNHSGYVSYTMDANIWSDKGTKYFAKKGQKAINDALLKSFKEVNKNKELSLPAQAPKHIIQSLIKNFAYTLKVYKIIDANFEIDLSFIPKNNNMANYKGEMKSNQLVHLDNKGELLKELNEVGRTLPEHILAAKIPSTGHLYQYMGGAITIGAELLDTSWRITQPIPKPKKNALKGFLRFRKYYRVNQPGQINLDGLFSETKNMKVEMTHFKKNKEFDKTFLTVDVMYSFNLADLIPKKEKAVVHFGELVSLDKNHDNIIKRIFQVFKKSHDVQTADLYIQGRYNGKNGPSKFKTKINRIVYNYRKNEFERSSSLRTFSNNSSQDFKINTDIRRVIFDKKNEDKLIEALKLEPLFDSKKI